MTPHEYERMRDVFDAVVDLPSSEQAAFVDENTPPGSQVRAELLAILAGAADSRFLASTQPRSTGDRRQADGGLAGDAQVGAYRLLRELGRGGMGIVYLALRCDDVFQKTVALKVIRAGVVSQEASERFKRERQILAGLDHPNIARILDGGNTEDGRPFYVMEYVDGAPIDEYCRRIGADAPAVIRLTTQVCEAVEHLHEKAIVHRDLKPGNVLVTLDGRVKVLDFGIAGIQTAEGLVDSPGRAGSRTRLLTPGFASPEQLSGSLASKASDVYSIGVLLYHLLTGRLPFTDDTGEPDLARQLTEAEPPPPSRVLAGQGPSAMRILPDLDRVVLTALRRDPVRRYASVRALREDLQSVLEGRAVTAHASTWTYRAGKVIGRNKLPVALTAALVLTLLVASVFALRATVKRAELEAKAADFESALAAWSKEIEAWAAPTSLVTPARKSEVIKGVAALVQSAATSEATVRAGSPGRAAAIAGRAQLVLEQAERYQGDAPSVSRDLAVAFRVIGDFRLALATTGTASKEEAIRSYEHAATAARALTATDRTWAERILVQLADRLGRLGAPLGGHPAASEPPAREQVPASDVSLSRRLPSRPAHAIDVTRQSALQQTLESTASRAERYKERISDLSAALEPGQSLRAEYVARLAQVEEILFRVREDLSTGQLDEVDRGLLRAFSILETLRGVVGS